MPCSDGGGPTDYTEGYQEKIRLLSTTLCGIFTLLEKEGKLEEILDLLDWKEMGISIAEVIDWWNKHQDEDNRRKQREKEARKQKKKQLTSEISRLQKQLKEFE